MSGSKRLLTEILKQELGFEGFLISDYNAIGQIERTIRRRSRSRSTPEWIWRWSRLITGAFIGLLRALVDEGRVPIARIDDAVKRILRVKMAMGLIDKRRSQLADSDCAGHSVLPNIVEFARRASANRSSS